MVAIDCQRYMVGERGVQDEPLSLLLRRSRWAAVDRIAAYFEPRARRARRCSSRASRSIRAAPISASMPASAIPAPLRLVPRGDGRRGAAAGGRACAGDIVFVKKKPSGFLGTPLLSLSGRSRSRHGDRARRRDQQLRARDRIRLRLLQFPHDRARRRSLRPSADLARHQPVRHGSTVRRRNDFRGSDRRLERGRGRAIARGGERSAGCSIECLPGEIGQGEGRR